MFESRKQEYTIANPTVKYDDYNYAYLDYETTSAPSQQETQGQEGAQSSETPSEATARIYIVVEDRTLQSNNDLNLYEGTLVGYTDNLEIDKNWLIDGKYVVTSTLPHRDGQVLYLKEYSNGK